MLAVPGAKGVEIGAFKPVEHAELLIGRANLEAGRDIGHHFRHDVGPRRLADRNEGDT